MKRVRCPKCEGFITFDETKYEAGQSLVFQCPSCGKEFGIRIGVSKLRATQKEEQFDEQANELGYGSIVVIENVFHYKQVIPLRFGDNTIGRYMKGCGLTAPIETNDPSIDIHHCVINVGRDKRGELKYVLRDGPSNTGTFVDNEILGDRERRVITSGTLFTIGATSIILRGVEEED
jgi:uncharacterized protein YbaR (Trm112 family)